MKKISLTQMMIGSSWISPGVIAHPDGAISKAYELEPLSSGLLEENFDGEITNAFFLKLSDLLSRLPNQFEGQIIVCRRALKGAEMPGFETALYCFEKVQNENSYSHFAALLSEVNLSPIPLEQVGWRQILTGLLSGAVTKEKIPDLVWEKDCIQVQDNVIRVLSLTELPQLTWKGCLQAIYEYPAEFTLSIRASIPDRIKIKRQLETKRRVSHALSVTNSVEVRNIESNSVLHSSEETLERILVGKETLFEISVGAVLFGKREDTYAVAKEFERVVSGVGNAGIYLEEVGTLPVLRSHIPGNKVLGIRKLPILSENFAHCLPFFHDFSRKNDASSLNLRSRTGEVSHLNLFSRENLNFNSFICGASGSGKSFLMNAILSAVLRDDPKSRLCIFDVGGSYRKIIEANGGRTTTLNSDEAVALVATDQPEVLLPLTMRPNPAQVA